VPFEDVSDQLGERCRRLIEDLELLEPRFEAGDSWLPVDSCYLLKHRVLGGLFVNPSKRSIATRVHARTEMMQWLWNHPGAFPSRPSLAELEAISPLLEKYTSFIDALKTGAVMLSLGSRGRVIFAHQRFLRLVDLTAESIERLLFNPYGLSLSTDRLVDWMLESETLELSPLPEALQLVRSRLDEEFSRPKSEIVEKYIARIKEGGPLSGGPTTDQSWTVRYEGGRFVISGYRPTSDGGLEQTLDPISEDEVRRMVGSYRMFGLSE
jgi:PAS domain-containing protein